ncbi:hypothetical protein BsIDN1_59100 [Bacillus safensis]|uniref:YcbB domain-containing protein n=1 Tax=Bacillus safensis TaxID=561879 RepID=A0A5S9MI15_BACIA|nr:hypothetical protein BsIDN1_59100 [Bacillus safensis]
MLAELGIVGEKGSKDLLDMILFTDQYLALHADHHDSFPSLKIIFTGITEDKLSEPYTSADIIAREAKAAEQRVRRAINQSLKHIASLGLTDFSHPTFENYASKFFDFTIVRKKMSELTKEMSGREEHTRINVKKFAGALLRSETYFYGRLKKTCSPIKETCLFFVMDCRCICSTERMS